MFVLVFTEPVVHGRLSGCFLLTDRPIVGRTGVKLI